MDRAKRWPNPCSHCSRRWRGFTPAVRVGARVSYLAPPCGLLYAGGVHYQFSTPLLLPPFSPFVPLLVSHILMRSLGILPCSCVETEVLSSEQYCMARNYGFGCFVEHLKCVWVSETLKFWMRGTLSVVQMQLYLSSWIFWSYISVNWWHWITFSCVFVSNITIYFLFLSSAMLFHCEYYVEMALCNHLSSLALCDSHLNMLKKVRERSACDGEEKDKKGNKWKRRHYDRGKSKSGDEQERMEMSANNKWVGV